MNLNRVWGYALKRPSLAAAPGAQIDVYQKGTTTHVTLYSDAAGTTPLANPFVADVSAYYDFYTPPQRIDVRISGTGITAPYTLGDVQPQQTFPQRIYNVGAFGAKFDGATDDRAAIQAAITQAIADGGSAVIQFPPGTARILGALSCPNPVQNLTFAGDERGGTILAWDDTAVKGLVIGNAPANVNTALAGTGEIGAFSVAVGAGQGANFTAGAWAFLQNTSDANEGAFLTTIQQVIGDTIYLYEALPCQFTVAKGAKIFQYAAGSFGIGVEVRNLVFQTNAATPVNHLTLLQLDHLDAPRVTNCTFDGAVSPLITTVTVKNGLICQTTLRNALTVAGTGIEMQTSTGMAVLANVVRLCQFGITASQSPYTRSEANVVSGRAISVALGRGIKYQGCSNFGAIVGNNISDTNLYGIYLQDAGFCTVTGNTISFAGVDPGEHGIQMGGFQTAVPRCVQNTITANVIRGCSGYGVAINLGAGGGITSNVVSGNNISGCAAGAVYCNTLDNDISGNRLSAPDTAAAVVNIATNGANNIVSVNVISREGVAITVGISASGSAGGNSYFGNKLVTPLVISAAATDVIGATTADVAAATPFPPTFIVTNVATGNDTLETEAWRETILANTLFNNQQGFHMQALFTFAGNNDVKTVRVYIGSITFVLAQSIALIAPGAYTVLVDVQVMYLNPAVAGAWVMSVTTKTDVNGNTPGGTSGSPAFDFTIDNDIVFTMQNGSAVANDIIFRKGALVYQGVPTSH